MQNHSFGGSAEGGASVMVKRSGEIPPQTSPMDQTFETGDSMEATTNPVAVSIDYSSSTIDLPNENHANFGTIKTYPKCDLSNSGSTSSSDTVAGNSENKTDLAMFLSTIYKLSNELE